MGECGLDFNRNFSPPETQLEVFEKQLQLACDLQKPLFLHEREAHTEMVRLLELYRERLPGCVIHCFTGSKAEAQKYLDMGCYIGLTGENFPHNKPEMFQKSRLLLKHLSRVRRISVERQVGGRRQKNTQRPSHPARPTAGGDGLTLHVPKHAGIEAAG